jgi:transcriptional regulator with XRE-family HTH domain
MTSGELIRSARLRAGLSQAELAKKLGVPGSSIGRWETDAVEPGYSTLRRVLQACGFDLPDVLEPYEPDRELDERIAKVRRLTPQERLAKLLVSRRRLWPLDPYVMLRELEYARLAYVVIGGLARIIHGSEEVTENLDIVPSLRSENLRRLQDACEALDARRVDMRPLGMDTLDAEREPWVPLVLNGGELHVVARPLGTRGYHDLRRRANREPLGEGLRPAVAHPADLVRMLEAHENPVRDPQLLPTMRRLLELEQGAPSER